MRIASIGTAYPPNRYPQAAITEAILGRMKGKPELAALMTRLHGNCGVEYRYLMSPPDRMGSYSGFGVTNNLWIKGAMELGEQAISIALDQAGIEPRDISAIFFTSVTGIACPSIDARLASRMGFRPDVKRTPMFGLGCVAGAAGLARAADYVKAHPRQYALLLSVELCSLTWQENDLSVANIVASGLFGDGSAAVLLAGEETELAKRPRSAKNPCPRVVDTRSTIYPDSMHMMGFDVSDTGFNIVLTADVPQLIREHLRATVDEFLADNNLGIKNICSYMLHSGGPKVLKAMEAALDLPPEALETSYKSLREHGNISSASVLSIVQDFMLNKPGGDGCYSIMGAMGPAICSELLLLQW